MKKYLMIVGLFLISYLTFAQADGQMKINDNGFKNTDKIKPLKIGDTVPDVEISPILNYPKSKIRMSDLRGKTVIFDFWSIWCAPCIAGLPKMDRIQQEFRNDVVVLPVYPFPSVSEKDIIEITKFWATNTYTKQTTLPTVLDTTLRKLFGYTVAYQAWVDKNGVLRAKTMEEYVNSEEIRKFNNGAIPDWAVATQTFYNFDTSMFSKMVCKENAPTRYSFLAGFMPETKSGKQVVIDSANNSIRFSCINLSILSLYRELLDAKKIHPTYLRLESNSPRKYFQKGYLNEWLRNNSYCYEISLPLNTSIDELYDNFRKDLNKYFKLNGRFERRLSPCYVIKPLNKPVFHQTGETIYDHPTIVESINELASAMNKINLLVETDIPVIDESNASGRMLQMKFPSGINFRDIDVIRKVLNTFGYDIQKENRPLNILIISEL